MENNEGEPVKVKRLPPKPKPAAAPAIAQPRSKKRYILTTAVVFLLAAAFGIFYYLANRPTEGTITVGKPAGGQSPPTGLAQVSGKYISFSYPAAFTVVPGDKPSGNELALYSYSKKPSPFYYLVLVVSPLASGNLNNDGSYHLRVSRADLYSAQGWEIGGQPTTVFSDKSQVYSKSLYLAHGGQDVSVALSADSTNPSLDQILKDVASSIVWR